MREILFYGTKALQVNAEFTANIEGPLDLSCVTSFLLKWSKLSYCFSLQSQYCVVLLKEIAP